MTNFNFSSFTLVFKDENHNIIFLSVGPFLLATFPDPLLWWGKYPWLRPLVHYYAFNKGKLTHLQKDVRAVFSIFIWSDCYIKSDWAVICRRRGPSWIDVLKFPVSCITMVFIVSKDLWDKLINGRIGGFMNHLISREPKVVHSKNGKQLELMGFFILDI